MWSRHRAVTATPASVSAGTSSPAPPRAAHVSPGMMTRSNTPCACAGRRCHITSRHVSRHGRRRRSHGARHYSTAGARTMQLRIGASSTGWSPSPRCSGLPPSSCPGNPCGHSRITRPRMRRNAYSQEDDKNKTRQKRTRARNVHSGTCKCGYIITAESVTPTRRRAAISSRNDPIISASACAPAAAVRRTPATARQIQLLASSSGERGAIIGRSRPAVSSASTMRLRSGFHAADASACATPRQ